MTPQKFDMTALPFKLTSSLFTWLLVSSIICSPLIYLIIMIILPENGLIQVCMLCFVFVYVLLMTDRWWCEGQSVVGVGPHSHSFWEETDEEVGEPAPHRLTVSTGPSEAPPHSASVSVLVIQFHSATQYMWTPGVLYSMRVCMYRTMIRDFFWIKCHRQPLSCYVVVVFMIWKCS